MAKDSAVLEERGAGPGSGEGSRTYSLVEVAQKTGIPMPILLRYKREQPNRVPSFGSGSQQRFPEEAFDAFLGIQREEGEGRELPRRGGFGLLSLPKLRRRPAPVEPEAEAPAVAPTAGPEAVPSIAARAGGGGKGRGRKQGAKGGGGRRTSGRGSASGSEGGEGFLTLGDVGERLGIPYPTVARYASQFEDRIPHEGKGRARRFPPAALEVFERIRRESKPGRPRKREAPGPRALRPVAPAARPTVAAPARPAAAAPSTGPGRSGDDALARRIESLERSQQILEDEIRDLLSRLGRPVTATVQVI
jgi:hypothetical protein